VRFGYSGNGNLITGDRSREEVTIWKDWHGKIGLIEVKPRGLGGWALDVQHAYDPTGQVIYLGSGGRQGAQLLGPVITNPQTSDWIAGMSVAPNGQVYYADSENQTIWRVEPSSTDPTQSTNIPVAGSGITGRQRGGFSGDGGQALDAMLNRPKDVAFGPDGSLYIADYGNQRVRRVAPDGVITTFAGGGVPFEDGDLAIEQTLSGPTGVEVGPDGTVYIADYEGDRIYRVGTDGRMVKVAGSGRGFWGDGYAAIKASLNYPTDIALAPDGSLYIADSGNNRIRHIDSQGIIHTVAGNGRSGLVHSGANGDGGPATAALINRPWSVAVAPDGSLYILEARRVRWVGPDRIIATVVGHPANLGAYAGDGTPALQTGLFEAQGMALGPDQTLYISSNYQTHNGLAGPRILRTQATMPGFAYHDIAIPSSDGNQLYQFDPSGRHLRTLDALTGVALYTFAYDPAGRLASVIDRDGLVTRIERDSAGTPTMIVSPYGQRTLFTLNGDGYLSTIANPAGEAISFDYTSGGLLTSLTDPRGGVHAFAYDRDGRLTRDTNPVGGFTALARIDSTHGYTVTLHNALGDTSTLMVETLPTGEHRRVNTAPNGAISSSISRPGGVQESTDAQGNVTTIVQGPSPRWGWMAPLVTSISMRTAAGQTYYTQTASRGADLFDSQNLLGVRKQTDIVTTNGHTTTTVYDGAAHTITSTDAAGKRMIMTLDALGRLVGQQTTNLAPTQYVYDEYGRLATISEGSGAATRTTTLAYTPSGAPASSTDPLGGTTTFVYDAAGRITRQTLPTGHVLYFSYDAAGNRVSATDAQGVRTSFEYDLQNRLIAQIRDPAGRAVRSEYTYDAANNLLAQLDDAGAGRLNVATHYTYTPIGSSYAVSSVTDALGQRTELRYTPFGALQSASDPLGQTSVMTYTAQGWLAEVASPGGRIVRTTYDTQGRPVSVTDPRGGVSVSTYDSLGWLQSVTAGAADVDGQPALNQTITYQYDLNGRVIGVTDPSGQTSTRTYDTFGRPASVGDPLGNTITFAYDALDRVVLKTVGANTPAQALRTAYSYDAAGRPLSERVDPDGLNLLTQYHYTRAGSSDTWSLQEVVDPKGHVTAAHFNSLGQRDQTIDARGQVWRFANDNLGRPVSQIDPLGHVVTYQVDPLGRTLALTEDGRTERRSYRADGLLATTTDFAGRTTSFSYDPDGHMLGVDYPAGTADVAYAYDQAGNLTAMTDGLGATSYAYDALNRLRERTRDGRTVGYSYDTNSQTMQIDYWGTGTVDYDHDSAGRLTSVTPWGADPTTYAYRGNGLLAEQTRGNGVTTSYGYDSASRLTSMLHAAGATNLDSIQYVLDLNGNRTQLTDGDGTTSFEYDQLNRLVSAGYPAIPGGPSVSSVPYNLDALGNRLSDGTTSLSYDASSRIATPGYSYDDNGNLLSDGTTSYSYDAANRLIQSVKAGITTTYAYDGKGNLIRENVGGVTADFVLDERGALPLILGELRSDGVELRYAYGSEGITAQQTISNTTQTTTYPLLDALGSVRRLTDAAGAVTLARSYDAFGNIRHSAGTGWTQLGFTGERMGVVDGTLYLRARHYSPALGRFLQRDSYAGTVGRPQSLNRYAYTENNPATLTDPSGHCPLCITIAAGAAIGAGFEYGSQVFQNYQSGKSGREAWTSVRGDKIAAAAVQGAVAGGVGFFAGPLVAGLTKMGPVVSVAAGALEGMASSALGQLAVNLLWRCDLNSNLWQSMLSGGLSGGLGGALGWAAKQAKAVVKEALSNQTKRVAVLADNGLAFFHSGRPDKAIDDALNVPALDGYFDIIGHGTRDGMSIVEKTPYGKTYYTAKQIAGSIESSFDTRLGKEIIGKDIRLLSCHLGKLDDGFAQELTDRTGRNVIAATDEIGVWEDGAIAVLNGGEWRKFVPGGSGGISFSHP
jgi:RHS repeat-associated protein